MARIEGIRIRNFGVLKDVQLGRTLDNPKAQPLTDLTAVIGPNGAGKSTLFDAFRFLADTLKYGVEEASYLGLRGGIERLRSAGSKGPIEFMIYYREDKDSRPITYELGIAIDSSESPYILYEQFRQRRKGQKHGRPYTFLYLYMGYGFVWSGESYSNMTDDSFSVNREVSHKDILNMIKSSEEESNERIGLAFNDLKRPAIATLGILKEHPRIAAFRAFLEGWYLSYFEPTAARDLPKSGPQPRLNARGDNLGNVVQYMLKSNNKKRFDVVMHKIANKIPSIREISHKESIDGRIVLRFNEQGFTDPFYASQMSDGTLKVFAYLLMLEDPKPPPFIGIEEPENGLYPKLIEALTHEFRAHTQRRDGAQIFLTTHQPLLVSAMHPDEVWIIKKGEDGFAQIKRASEFEDIVGLTEEGIPLGSLWISDYLD